jgi:hypothetical protein
VKGDEVNIALNDCAPSQEEKSRAFNRALNRALVLNGGKASAWGSIDVTPEAEKEREELAMQQRQAEGRAREGLLKRNPSFDADEYKPRKRRH